MRVYRYRLTLALVILLLVAPLFATALIPASAHANLVKSDPAENAVLDTAPATLRMWFSEAPEPHFSQVVILDKNGNDTQSVGPLTSGSDPTLLFTNVKPLPNGVYTVSWRALSAVDGHITAGAFAFAIGKEYAAHLQDAMTSAENLDSSGGATVPGVVLRWLGYLSMALLVGGFAFVPLIFQPVSRRVTLRPTGSTDGDGGESASFSHASRLFSALVIGWAVLLIDTLAGAIWQAITSANTTQLSGIAPALIDLLSETRYGVLFWIRLALVIILGGLLAFRQSGRWRPGYALRWWWAGFAVAVFVMLTFSLESHAAAEELPALPTLADWLHLTAVGVWVGGLGALLLTLRWLRRTMDSSSGKVVFTLISRFSQVAGVCVGLIAITGGYRALTEVQDVANFLDTPYGFVLLIKLLLLVPLLGIAGVNLLVIERGMRKALADNSADTEAATRPWRRLIRRTVVGEIVFVTAVLLVTGVLTSLPPSREAFGNGIVVRGQADDLRVILSMTPGEPGLNTFSIFLKDALGRPVDGAQEVSLVFTMQQHDMGPNQTIAKDVGGGQYVFQGGYTSMYGTYRADVLIRRNGMDDVHAYIDMPLELNAALTGIPVLISPSKAILGVEIIIAAALLFLGSRRIARLRRWAGTAAVVLGVLIALFGVSTIAGAFVDGSQAVFLIQNPIAADNASLARGQQIFQANCALCHGPSGAGDGPLAQNFNPPPANLQVHMAAGHTDGDLFAWITDGIANTAMPAFGNKLSENERWDVINYIRTFAQLLPPTPTSPYTPTPPTP